MIQMYCFQREAVESHSSSHRNTDPVLGARTAPRPGENAVPTPRGHPFPSQPVRRQLLPPTPDLRPGPGGQAGIQGSSLGLQLKMVPALGSERLAPCRTTTTSLSPVRQDLRGNAGRPGRHTVLPRGASREAQALMGGAHSAPCEWHHSAPSRPRRNGQCDHQPADELSTKGRENKNTVHGSLGLEATEPHVPRSAALCTLP